MNCDGPHNVATPVAKRQLSQALVCCYGYHALILTGMWRGGDRSQHQDVDKMSMRATTLDQASVLCRGRKTLQKHVDARLQAPEYASAS